MNRTVLFVAAIVLLAIAVQAEDATTPEAPTPPPKSLAARQAETKFNAEMQKLDTEYQQKATAIKLAYVEGLKAALKTLAAKDNADPDEIARLSAKIKEVQATVVQVPVATPQVKRISGRWKNKDWTISFRKNGVAILSGLNNQQLNATWVQDGSVVVLCIPDWQGYDRVVLSNDGKTMRGANAHNQAIIYTFIGD